MLNVDSVLFGIPRRIFWERESFCLNGFATFVGGPNYIKNCLRTISMCLVPDAQSANRCVPLTDRDSLLEDQDMKASFREVSATSSTFDARRYITDVLEELVLFDPVTGQKVVTEVTVQELYRRYSDDAREDRDIHIVSATAFRVAWNDIVKIGEYVIRSPRRVHKCDVCLELNSEIRKVRLIIIAFIRGVGMSRKIIDIYNNNTYHIHIEQMIFIKFDRLEL